jgi:tetratricopeptide (TPR) repeat protein
MPLHLLLIACLAAAPGVRSEGAAAAASSQTPAQADAQATLDRIGKELFAGGERAAEAVDELKKVLAVDPRSAKAHFLLGVAYGRLGQSELMGEAAAEFRQALDLEPTLVQARYYLAQVYVDMGRAERARTEMETALKQVPEHPQFLALLGEIERQLGRPNRSLELNRQALARDASFAQARYYVGLALLDLRRRDEGIRELEQVAKSGVELAEVYSSLGGAYQEAGRIEPALAALERGHTIDPSRLDIRIRLARAYREKGRIADAARLLGEAVGSGAASPAAQQLQAELALEQGLLALDQNRPREAIAAFNRALQVNADLGPAHLRLAQIHLRLGDLDLAAKHAARAERLGSPLPKEERARLQQKRQAK